MREGEVWKAALATAVGTSHASTGSPCQDSAAFELVSTSDGDVLVAVVCDGAGSAAHAEIGSWLAARTITEIVELHFENGGALANVDRERAAAWLERVAETLAADAGANGRALRDYACTLLLAVIGRDAALFVQIGDGAIVVSRGEDEDWTYVFWPQHGEFANTTNFVISADAGNLFDFAFVAERIEEAALFSDGLENLVLHQATRTVHEPFFRSMIAPVRRASGQGVDEKLSTELGAFLLSERVCERTDDDKALLLATRLVPKSKVAVGEQTPA